MVNGARLALSQRAVFCGMMITPEAVKRSELGGWYLDYPSSMIRNARRGPCAAECAWCNRAARSTKPLIATARPIALAVVPS